ncbi:neprilysin-4 [Bactrocera dorsalis]|uniref:Neprilysin-4 n=1 Tax=Bactrocera dorsalis TaxID=27457 RepID=A0A6I9VMN5_BACDO|nr:neprilysin-4 [Bactrocera dorsalis]
MARRRVKALLNRVFQNAHSEFSVKVYAKLSSSIKMLNICRRVLFTRMLLTLLLLGCVNSDVNAATAAATNERTSTYANVDHSDATPAPTSAPSSGKSTPPACAADYWPRQLDTMHAYVDDVMWPCDDFYEYACGNWRAPYQLRARGAHDTLSAVKADNKQQLMAYLLERQGALHTDSRATMQRSERVAVRFFNACVERVTGENSYTGRSHLNVEAATLRPYTDALRRISDWPVLNPNWETIDANNTLNWGIYLSAELRRYGVQSLWRLLVTSNWQQAEQQILYISAAAFDLLKPTRNAAQYDSDSEYVYKRYVKYLMLDLGMRVRRAQAIASEVVEFEKRLFELVPSESLVLLREPQTLSSLAAELPELNLREYFGVIMRDIADELPNDYAERLLIVADIPYLRKLRDFLKRTKPEVLAKYLLVQFLAHFEVSLHDEESFQEQRDYCLQQLHAFLPAELTEMFMRLQYGDRGDAANYMAHTDSALNDIFTKLKMQFEHSLNATNVFERDALTKSLGMEKLHAMRLLLPQAANVSKAHLPSTIELSGNHDANLLKLWRWRTHSQLHEVLETLLTGRSAPPAYNNYGPLDVNAYYRLKKNAIELPIGILRAPFYHSCLDAAKIYGSFVYIIAHELMHGFDYDGLNYDQAGNMVGNWGAKAIIRFGTKSRCYLSERYDDGEVTLNENIADTEGLRLALETYRRSVGENNTLTTAQLKLFFLSFAQTWCGTNASRTNNLHDAHSVRVNNVVSNFEEFASAYGCGKQSPMNPPYKCSIWAEE